VKGKKRRGSKKEGKDWKKYAFGRIYSKKGWGGCVHVLGHNKRRVAKKGKGEQFMFPKSRKGGKENGGGKFPKFLTNKG